MSIQPAPRPLRAPLRLVAGLGLAIVLLSRLPWGAGPAFSAPPPPTFVAAPGSPIAVGSRPVGVAAGNFIGEPGLAVTNSGSNTVSVLLGNGNGTFQPPQTLATGNTPLGVAAADFTGSGILDLAVADRNDNAVSVLLGNGDGTFQLPVAYDTGSAPTDVAVANFGGVPGLAVTNSGGSAVSVLVGNGNGTFQPAHMYTTGTTPVAVAVAGFTGSGYADLAVADAGDNTVSILLGNGDGTFQPAQTYATGVAPAGVAVGNFNGKPSVAVANRNSNTLSILLGNGDGTFQPPSTFPAGPGPTGVVVADFNSDGSPDLAVTDAGDNSVSILVGNGDGTFQPPLTLAAGSAPEGVAVANFNGDGKPSLAVANAHSNNVSVLLDVPPALTPDCPSAEPQTVSGDNPTAAVGGITATASGGSGTLGLAPCSSNPVPPPHFTSSTVFDVRIISASTFTGVTITVCGVPAGSKLIWLTPAGTWQAVSPPPVPNASGCLTVTITSSSSPSLSQLTGTLFAVGFPSAQGPEPTGEEKFCTNTSTLQGLSQVIGGNTLETSISGPATSFQIPLFGGASTCWIQLTQSGQSCNTTILCSDGYVTVSLTTPGSEAVLACASTASPYPAGQAFGITSATTGLTTFPLATGPQGLYQLPNGGACQSQTSGTSLLLPCGATAGTPAALTTPSATCTSVEFDIASFVSGCFSQTSNIPCPSGSNASALSGGPVTLTVSFQGTAANIGVAGAVVLGTNTFTFQAPGVGTLLVTATPQLIPSNGTLASVITATFACGSGFSLTPNGFPLSAGGIVGTGPNFTSPQGILGFGNTATCGAGMPGNFTFATPGEVLFDNGRTSESVGCGLNGQQNLFGGSSLFNPNNLNPTLPLVFTCTGAAALAIGGGAAGDAPINVTYTSSVGGLTAVGSTLITVAPSGVPRISVACNPSTIAAGNTGSLCTATVTDQNGTPLTGSEGATVTWTVSDTTVAQILPCVVNLGAANGVSPINITTSPNFIPQIVPNAPCNPASGSIPGQSVTFLNGQTTALLVASSYAHPEVVTVSAVLGALVPPEYACEVSPYIPVGYGAAQFLGSAAPSGFGPGLTGCGAGNPVGLTGLASALSTAGSEALNGIVSMPNTTSANTTVTITGPANVQVVGAAPTAPLGLLHGCNNIIVTTTAGTPTANIAALVSPSDAVTAVWAFNNSTKQWRGAFFSDPAAPVDFNVTGGTSASQQGGAAASGANGLALTSSNVAAGTQVTEGYFICVNQAAEIVSG